jgi:hypothetical protein
MFGGIRGIGVSVVQPPSVASLSIYLIIKYLSTKKKKKRDPLKPIPLPIPLFKMGYHNKLRAKRATARAGGTQRNPQGAAEGL